MELTSSSFLAQSQLDFGKGVVRWPHNQLQLAVPGHGQGYRPTTFLQSFPLPMYEPPQKIETTEERQPWELQNRGWGSFQLWRGWNCWSIDQEGCASSLVSPGIRDAGFSHLLLTELRCRRPEFGGRKRAVVPCRDVLMQRSGQSTLKWETMYRVGQQSRPGSKGRGAPVLEPHGSRTAGVEAQLKRQM